MNSVAPGNSDRSRTQQVLHPFALADDERSDRVAAHGDSAIPGQRFEQADIVVAQVAREVVGRRQLDAFRGERLLKGGEVQRLAVGDHTVEVEHDGLQRTAHAPGAFSPARISTFSRFDGGGYGHS